MSVLDFIKKNPGTKLIKKGGREGKGQSVPGSTSRLRTPLSSGELLPKGKGGNSGAKEGRNLTRRKVGETELKQQLVYESKISGELLI